LRLLLDREGVGVELSLQSYEDGDWAGAVEEAWAKGKGAKWRKRKEGEFGIGLMKREEDGKKLARKVLDWARDWWMLQSDGDMGEFADGGYFQVDADTNERLT